MRIHPLALLLLLAVPPLAAASPPEPTARASTVHAQDSHAGDRSAGEERPAVDRHCVRETGSHIRLRGERRACTPFAGRVWTRDDLDRTGEVDIASALRRLDVSIR